jgi:hypothetical protein
MSTHDIETMNVNGQPYDDSRPLHNLLNYADVASFIVTPYTGSNQLSELDHLATGFLYTHSSLAELRLFAEDYVRAIHLQSGRIQYQNTNISTMEERNVPTTYALTTLDMRMKFGGVVNNATDLWNFNGINDHVVDRFQVDYLGYATIAMLADYYDDVYTKAKHAPLGYQHEIGPVQMMKEKADRVCYAFGLWGFSNIKRMGPNGGSKYAANDIVYLFLCRPPLSSVQPIMRQNSVGGGGCSQWIMTRRKVTQQGVQRAVWRNKVTAKLATKRMVTQSGSTHRTASFVPL